MTTAIFPGTWPVFNNGDLAAIEDAAKSVKTLYVAVGTNPDKKDLVFDLHERFKNVKEGTKHIPNVEVIYLDGLMINTARRVNASVVIRGIKELADFQFEGNYASMAFAKGVLPTLWVPARQDANFINPTFLTEYAKHGADISEFVSAKLAKKLLRKFNMPTKNLQLRKTKRATLPVPGMHEKTSAIYPGSFDPFHNGHLAVAETAAASFDKVIIAVGVNPTKTGTFDIEKRMELIRESVKHLPNVEVTSFQTLLIDKAAKEEATVVIKGIRGVEDFSGESIQAFFNGEFGNLRTMYVPSQSRFFCLSSSMLKYLAGQKLDISKYVPKAVVQPLMDAMQGRSPEEMHQLELEFRRRPFANAPTLRTDKIDLAKYRVIVGHAPEQWVEAFTAFVAEVVLKTQDPNVIESIRAFGFEIANRWSEPHRKHHGMSHLVDMWNNVIKDCVYGNINPIGPLLATAGHDVIYDPAAKGNVNEVDSASWTAEGYKKLGIKKKFVNKTVNLILKTSHHDIDLKDPEACVVFDADCACLQAPWPIYVKYAIGTYFEYAGGPDAPFTPEQYFKGRLHVLQSMIDRPKLYSGLTPSYSDERARENIQKEINVLLAFTLKRPNGFTAEDVAQHFGIENLFHGVELVGA